jgi:putative PEP-CTERM system integral membrane protein
LRIADWESLTARRVCQPICLSVYLSPSLPVSPSPPSNMNKFFKLLFWISNITFLLILCVGFLPSMGRALASDAFEGKVPIDLMMPFVGLVGVPIATTIAGRKQRTKITQSLSLFELFYALEAPILAICAIRLFILRDLTPATSFLLVSGVLGWLGSCYWFWQQRQAESTAAQRGNLFSLVGLSLFLLVSLYLAAIASFFVLPVGVWFLAHPEILFVTVVIFPLFACGLAIASSPFGMVFVSQKLWSQQLQHSIDRYGKWSVQALVGGLAIVWLGVFIALQQQPQIEALALLNKQPVDRQAYLQKSAFLRQGLVNAYLADYRYLRHPDDRTVFNAYRWLHVPAPIAQVIQNNYNLVTKPVTYQGKRADRQTAETLYSQFFDESILRGEKDTIRHAVESNFNRSEANAGLLSVDAKRVLLARQEVKISPHGDWADVELHETYENQTFDREEIFYYFSLPESAAVTGVWLGETEDRASRFPFQISTRGAAQKIYKQEIQRRVDPALLEQVGPQNYRLRVYPILPKGQPMHMWMTYKVMKQNGNWPLPQLSEHRNVYWSNRHTKRTIDDKPVAIAGEWLPHQIAANKSVPEVHQLTLPNSSNIIAKPFDPKSYNLPKNQRLAIVLDGSYSMNAHRSEVEKTIDWLRSNILPHNQIDLYLTANTPAQAQLLPITGFKPDRAIFYGKIEPQQMLEQFQTLSQTAANPKYDAIVAITDRGSYELTTDRKQERSMPAPLWMVHLGGLPHAYDDGTLASIQSSGGSVSTDIKTVMQRIATLPSLGQNTSLLSVVDDYAWFLSQAKDPAAQQDNNFDAIAARQWVTQVSQFLKPTQLKELDAVHVLAKRYNIVTPYSSAIVLVNDRQKADLKAAEQDKDRFHREGEDRQLPSPQSVAPSSKVSATPEPAEWLLLAISLLMLGIFYRRTTTVVCLTAKLNGGKNLFLSNS